jgi:hypothetical protein
LEVLLFEGLLLRLSQGLYFRQTYLRWRRAASAYGKFENNFAENNCRELQKDVKYKKQAGKFKLSALEDIQKNIQKGRLRAMKTHCKRY